MAGEEAPCLAASALSLPLRPCSARGDDRSREGEPSDTSRSERLGTVASVAGRRNWILELARHYGHVRSAHPTDRLLVVFEIDGPVVDQRHIVRRRLLDYDRVHGTTHFSDVEPAEVDVDAGNLERFITRQGLPATGTNASPPSTFGLTTWPTVRSGTSSTSSDGEHRPTWSNSHVEAEQCRSAESPVGGDVLGEPSLITVAPATPRPHVSHDDPGSRL
jgi:hypothetical protein